MMRKCVSTLNNISFDQFFTDLFMVSIVCTMAPDPPLAD